MGKDRIIEIAGFPWLRRFERFHGLGADRRYRKLKANAAAFIHPECRTILSGRVPQAVMLHDFLSLDERAPWYRRKPLREIYFRYKMRKAARCAERLFANSEYTRTEALRRYPFLPPGRVTALHLGARPSLHAAAPPAPTAPGVLRFLYVGSFEPRKNLDALFVNLRAVTGGRPFRFDLAGRIDARERARLEARARAVPEGEVVFHGRVDDAALAGLYAQARYLLFPSLGEGFGLPLAEAMGAGLAVFAFSNTCIPEIVGDAAVLAADNDFAAWGAELAGLANDAGRFAALTVRARARAERFTEAAMLERYGAYFRDWFASLGWDAAEKP